ncbi:hypothetical protein B14911_10597 [Bacillus sp. NRRL B-14911]|uniref:hypothetical protein n=1 Tax=Bacillus sp. NRRL B-14911 TaxID=313627 RepID=UPI00006B5980|nr:hypothetical protein [Bacillus sp. NRRL B-14911]EAR66177.1 hypothetical protein B14911_10597 [Bacillus sp. NRRL B-14911]
MARTLFDEVGTTFEIYLISDNTLLKEYLQAISKVTLLVQMPRLEPNISCKAIVIDGKCFPQSELKELRKLYPEIPVFYQFYQVTNEQQMKNLQMICAAHRIVLLSEFLSEKQIEEEVEKHLFAKESVYKNRIISFFGTHSGAGVSTTVLNVADLLAQQVNEKVLVLSLNPWDPADYFLPYEGKYLSDIKIELKTGGITEEKLQKAVHHYPNSFYHLAGNRDIKLQRYYRTEEISTLLDTAKKVFDVILIDAGTHFDNAAFAQAYKQSDLKFLVTTQEPKGFRGYWPHIFHQLLEPIGGKADEYLLILNRFVPDMTLITEKAISEELDMNLLATIPDENVYGQTAIAQKRLLHTVTNNKEYPFSLRTIINSIITRANLTYRTDLENEFQQRGFLGFFRKKKAVN